jgi:hypothetical protein
VAAGTPVRPVTAAAVVMVRPAPTARVAPTRVIRERLELTAESVALAVLVVGALSVAPV